MSALLLVALLSLSASADFTCYATGDEIEIEPLGPEAAAWMQAESFVPWRWENGHRVPVSGLYSPGYRNDIAWLTYAEAAGFKAAPECWALARRYPRQN